MGNTLYELAPCYDPEPPLPPTVVRTVVAPRATVPRPAAVISMPANIKSPSFRAGPPGISQQIAFENKYELLNVIGQGSTSTVRRCRERTGLRREFGCKIIDKKKVSSQYSQQMEQFENEIEVLMKLQQTMDHPNIIHLEDVFITPTTIYMVAFFSRLCARLLPSLYLTFYCCFFSCSASGDLVACAAAR